MAAAPLNEPAFPGAAIRRMIIPGENISLEFSPVAAGPVDLDEGRVYALRGAKVVHRLAAGGPKSSDKP
jgi:hypothetical protein